MTSRAIRRIVIGLALAVISAILAGGWFHWRSRPRTLLPLATVRQGDFRVLVPLRGRLVALRRVRLRAPLVWNGLTIVYLVPAGTRVRAGDVVVRFDTTQDRKQITEDLARLKQAQSALDQAVAQAQITTGQDRITIADQERDLQSARLEASKAAILSPIQGAEDELDVTVDAKKLKTAHALLLLHQRSSDASIAFFRRARDYARTQLELTRKTLRQLVLTAPGSGIATIDSNMRRIGAEPWRPGDNAFPGQVIAEIPDLTSLRMRGNLSELDRGRIQAGAPVLLHVDSLPGHIFRGHIETTSPVPIVEYGGGSSHLVFQALARFKQDGAGLLPGMRGTMDVVVNRIPACLIVPAGAVFTRNAQSLIYLVKSRSIRPVAVRVLATRPDAVAIAPLSPGAVAPGMAVALRDPYRVPARPAAISPALKPGGAQP